MFPVYSKTCLVGLLIRSILRGKIARALQHSLLSHTPLCIWLIPGVCVQGMWNAQVKGQVTKTHRLKVNSPCDPTLFISVYDITMSQPQQPLVGTIATTSSQLGTNSSILFHQVSSFHIVKRQNLFSISKWKHMPIFWINILCALWIRMCDKSRIMKHTKVVSTKCTLGGDLVTPLSCVSLSMNAQPVVPAMWSHELSRLRGFV